MREATSDLWWKNAIVYCLDVETFMDADGDGCGDFRGLTKRVDYLDGLGVTCIWLLPFYPTPNRDDGYDITDFYAVDPRLGTLGEFVEFVRAATERGIRVVVDLVVNHTSKQHPWFQSARSDPNSPYRDWYVWAEEPPAPEDQNKVIFPNVEESNWAYDDQAGLYYLHRFYSEQPDLNVANPAVRDEIHRIMGFWLQLGVSGFRIDAVPYLIGTTGIEESMAEDPHAYLRSMRSFMSRRRGDAVMLGEVNLAVDEQRNFFGDDRGEDADELQLLFNFVGAGKLFLALARRSAAPLADLLATLQPPPRGCQYANFARNHDELNLSRLPGDEQEEVMRAFAPDEGMRMFGRGIRRRLPPMLGRDERLIRLAYSLVLTLPGTPTLFYGEEIGLGENLGVRGRLAVRTPMHWSHGPNAGFSTAATEDLIRPVISGAEGGYDTGLNVADERQDADSLLNWMERAIRARKEAPEFGWGDWRVLDGGSSDVLVHLCDWIGSPTVAIHNLGDQERRVKLDVADFAPRSVTNLLGDRQYPDVDPDGLVAEVDATGYRWLRIEI